jgi:protein SCO1/2
MRLETRLLLCGLLAVALAGSATAQTDLADRDARGEPLPEELENVGVTEKLEAQVPLDLEFQDANGQTVTLAKYFDGARPVILNLGYMSCPMLCGLVSNGMVDAMREMDHTAGEEYRVLTVSIDHTETPTLSKINKQKYLKAYERQAAGQGWHWLTGREDQIRALTEAVGFGFEWNEQRQEYAHAAVLIVLSPEGQVMRYLYGIQFDPRTLELSLIEAADGKTGSSLDKFLLFCFQYDHESGRYGPVARNIMKAGGAVTVLVIGGLILGLRLRERRSRREA